MKAVGVLGTRGHVDNAFSKTTSELMSAVGNNTGNLVFQHAVFHQITEEKYVIALDQSWDIGRIREECRVLAFPAANFIRENFDFTRFVDLLEKADLPLVFVGLGAQADTYDKTSFDLHPSILRLIDLIKERSKLTAIRGNYTARVLDQLGLTDTKVTGCPSNFINLDPNLQDMIAAKMQGPLRSFITHGDEPWPRTDEKQSVERRLATWTMDGAAMQSQQSVPAFMEYIRANNVYSNSQVPDQREEGLRKALMPTATVEQFRAYIAAKLRVYLSVSQWMEDSAKYDFSIGLRLHGNMVAWQAGVPSLWLYHDARTRELAEVMAVPSMDFRDFLTNCLTVQEARARMDFDKEAYRLRRTELVGNLIDVYDAAGIQTNLASLRDAPTPAATRAGA